MGQLQGGGEEEDKGGVGKREDRQRDGQAQLH